MLDELGRRQVTSLLVEGGAEVLAGFFDAGLVDEIRFYLAPILTGEGPPALRLAKPVEFIEPRYRQLGPDVHVAAFVARRTTGGNPPSENTSQL